MKSWTKYLPFLRYYGLIIEILTNIDKYEKQHEETICFGSYNIA